MIAPHFDLIIQCLDVVKGLPTGSWATLAPPARRTAALVGRWAIEKAFASAIIARGADIPYDCSLVTLHNLSGVRLTEDQRLVMEIVDKKVTAQDLEETDDAGLYRDCCSLAHGIVKTVHTQMTINDIYARMPTGRLP